MKNDTTSEKLITYAIESKSLNKWTDPLSMAAQHNQVMLYLIERNKNLSRGNSSFWKLKFSKTLKFLAGLGSDPRFLIVRTYKYIPYVTFDVDVFVEGHEFDNFIKLLQKKGWSAHSHDNSLGGRIKGSQINLKCDGYLTIDLHRDFTWQARRFLSMDLMFEKTRKKTINGIEITVPSAEVEFLLCLADICHERYFITLLDIVWLNGLLGEIKDWKLIREQVSRYKWVGIFKGVVTIINEIFDYIYGKQLLPGIGKSDTKIELPYFLPLFFCWFSYVENILGNKNFPLISFAYCHYSRLRYYLSSKIRMPFYDNWYKPNKNYNFKEEKSNET